MASKGGKHQPLSQDDPDEPSISIQDEKKVNADFDLNKSKWQSGIFKVDRDEVDAGEEEVDSPDAAFMDKMIRKVIIPSFIICALLAVIAVILGFVISEPLGFAIVFLLTWAGAVLGAWGTYKFGSVQEVIDMFKEQNVEFESNIEGLTEQRENLSQETELVFNSVRGLEKSAGALEDTLHEFDTLRNHLQELCGDNQELNDMLNQMNNQVDDMNKLILQNEKATLLEKYYETSTKDDEKGLSKKEYKRFLGRLNKGTRKLFEDSGSFEEHDTDHSGSITLNEFQIMLDTVLEQFEMNAFKDIKNKM